MAQETQRTFTQEQAGEMYSFLLRTYGAGLTDYETLYTLRRRAAEILDRIHSAATPDTPPAGTGSGARYVPKRHETSKFRYCVWDTETETALQIASERFIWTTLPRVKRECQRLNSSKRYVVKTDPPGAMFTFRKIVDTETSTEIEGVYLSPEAAERECNRLNGGE